MDTLKDKDASGYDSSNNRQQHTGEQKVPQTPESLKDEADEIEEQQEEEALKKELDSNFPLSGGGTEPYFDNEGA